MQRFEEFYMIGEKFIEKRLQRAWKKDVDKLCATEKGIRVLECFQNILELCADGCFFEIKEIYDQNQDIVCDFEALLYKYNFGVEQIRQFATDEENQL